MLTWIIIAVFIYLLIGIGILIYGVLTDPYGGLMLEIAIPFVLFYPYFIIRSIIGK